MFKGIKKLIAVLVIATGAWAQVWDGSSDTDWAGITDFTITTPAQLAGFAQLVNEGNDFAGRTITLGADIMLNDTTNWQDWATNPPANEWTAIGWHDDNWNEYLFNGTFDGAGFVVSGVYIDKPDNRFLGLFGEGGSMTLKNLGVIASYVKGLNEVGGLVGENVGTIENSYYTGSIVANGLGGGLVGENYFGTIKNSYSTGNVTSLGTEIGGLVGSNWGTIENSYATGNVNSSDDFAGGLAGSNYGTITNSYATGNVEANGKSFIGGLVGDNGGTITNSYAIGSVEGNEKVGGLVGDNEYGTIENSYYNSETSGQSDDDGRGTPKTTAEMKLQATFDDWDFADVWGINSAINGGYPHLRVFEPIPPSYHLITVHEEGGGIANANEHSAPQGAQITLTATPGEGNHFVQWQVVSGGITLSSTTTATATFTMPDNPVEVKAVFEATTPILPLQIASGNKAVQMHNGLSLTAASNATVEIYGLNGNLVSRQNFASGVYAISLGHLPKGIYIVKATFGNEKQILRMPIR